MFISYILLCFKPDSSSNYFRSILIFSASLLYDYLSLYYCCKNNKNNLQKCVAIIGMICGLLCVFVGIIGVLGILEIDINSRLIETTTKIDVWKLKINYDFFMKSMLVFPILAGLEVFNKFPRIKTKNESIYAQDEAASAQLK